MKNKSKTHLFPILVLLLSFTVISCSGGGSSNGSGNDGDDINGVSPPATECSDGFGDASRCDSREQL